MKSKTKPEQKEKICVTAQIDRQLKARLDAIAARDERSLNWLMEKFLLRGVMEDREKAA